MILLTVPVLLVEATRHFSNRTINKDGAMTHLRLIFVNAALLLLATMAVTQTVDATRTEARAAAGSGGTPRDTNPAAPAPPVTTEPNYDDKNLTFQIVGGIEQSGIASNASTTNAFLSAFTSAGPSDRFRMWGRIRLLGAAQASTGGVISAFQDPTGQIKNLDTQKVGQAVDFSFGPDIPLHPWGKPNSKYSIHFIAGIGATTPLSSEDVVSKFAVPAKGSPQCAEIIAKFTPQNGYPANLILPDPTGTNCLANGVTVLAFNRQERTSFLRKYGFGIRTINKFPFNTKSETNQCCEMGMVDFLLGQDEAITGGSLRGWVFRVDGVHPLPIKGTDFLYLFGTASLRLNRNQDLRTIILNADTSNANPSAANVALLPLKQPNKDFYRFGVGLDIKKIFTTLF